MRNEPPITLIWCHSDCDFEDRIHLRDLGFDEIMLGRVDRRKVRHKEALGTKVQSQIREITVQYITGEGVSRHLLEGTRLAYMIDQASWLKLSRTFI